MSRECELSEEQEIQLVQTIRGRRKETETALADRDKQMVNKNYETVPSSSPPPPPPPPPPVSSIASSTSPSSPSLPYHLI